MTIYAIDFDGTIVEEKFPAIGELNPEAADFIHHLQQNGDKWILFTLREEQYLEEALAFLHANGLHPDAVNDNLPETIQQWGNNPRKISADVYIDDRNLGGLRFSPYRIGDKLKFAGNLWTVVKTKPCQILLKGYGYKKRFDLEDIEREQQNGNGK